MSIGNSGNPGGDDVGNLLVQGFRAAKENRRDEAYNLFCEVVQRDPNNEMGWLYRAATTDDLSEAYVCLQRVLNINPNNEKAQRGIERIQSRLNSDDGDEAGVVAAAPPPPPSSLPRSTPPAQFGGGEVVSGFQPAPAPNFGGNYGPTGEQATAQFPFENSTSQFGRSGGAPNVPPANPPYQPSFDSQPFGNAPDFGNGGSFGNNSPDYNAGPFGNNSPDYGNAGSFGNSPSNFGNQPSFGNDNSFGGGAGYYGNGGNDEMVDEPVAATGAAGRNRTRDRLKIGGSRGPKENPRIGGNTPTGGTKRRGTASAGLAPILNGLGNARNRGRAALGSSTNNTSLDPIGQQRAERARRISLIVGIALIVLALLVLFIVVIKPGSNNNTAQVPPDNTQAIIDATSTANAANGIGTDQGTPGLSPDATLNPGGSVAPTSSGSTTVPVIGGTTPVAGATPTPVVAAQPPTATPGAAAPTAVPASPRPVVYTVKAGDNLTKLSQQFSTTADAIKAANPNPKLVTAAGGIFANTQIVIPVSRGTYRGKGGVVLQANQTLQTLADQYKVTVDAIVSLNGLGSPTDVKAGDPILIP